MQQRHLTLLRATNLAVGFLCLQLATSARLGPQESSIKSQEARTGATFGYVTYEPNTNGLHAELIQLPPGKGIVRFDCETKLLLLLRVCDESGCTSSSYVHKQRATQSAGGKHMNTTAHFY